MELLVHARNHSAFEKKIRVGDVVGQVLLFPCYNREQFHFSTIEQPEEEVEIPPNWFTASTPSTSVISTPELYREIDDI